ncbi:ribbon-helix-helix protein, copG family [archaeon]|nr:ribbon-helix-helix protein, copG family [archaeon]
MRNPVRITIALDKDTSKLLEELKAETKLSQSELLRRALKHFAEQRKGMDIEKSRVETYIDMLGHGEHVILDVDHWQLFLGLIGEGTGQEEFWEAHLRVASSHAEQLKEKIKTPYELIKRLEACNFFKLSHTDEKDLTLIFGSETARKFIRTFLEESFKGMGFNVEIKEDFTKLRVKVLD